MEGGCRERVLVVATPGASPGERPCAEVYILRLGGVEGLRQALSRSRPHKVVVVVDSSRPEAAAYAAAVVKALGYREVVVEAPNGLDRMVLDVAEKALSRLGGRLSEEELIEAVAEVFEELEGRWRAIVEALYSGPLAPLASMATLVATLFLVFSVSTGFPLDLILASLGLHGASSLVGELAPSNLISSLFEGASLAVESSIPGAVGSLFSAILNGVGVVASLAPVVGLTVLAVAALEDSGLMARVAIGLRPITAPLGMPSQALYPLLIATGCNVPAVVTAGRLGDARLLKALSLAAPLVPCSARLAVIAAFSFALFKNPLMQAVAAASVYVASIVLATIVVGVAYRLQGGGDLPRISLDLPPLKKPSTPVILEATFEAVREFSVKIAGPVAVVAALIWSVTSPDSPEAARLLGDLLASVISPLFALADIQGHAADALAFAAVAGAVAKEMVLEALAVQAGTPNPWDAVEALGLTPAQAYATLLFYTLYTPCIATAAAIIAATRSLKVLAASYLISLASALTSMTLIYTLFEVMRLA
ncbi:MAG: hypothetical protein F7B17_02875 [Desulfurococcales archaeon]|nr:hypothetical protein [Desulfurococcales archaeon]